MPPNEKLIARAYAAWLKFEGEGATPPDYGASTVELYDDLVYVVLRRAGRVVDIYRYTASQMVRLRNNWPGSYGKKNAQRVAA